MSDRAQGADHQAGLPVMSSDKNTPAASESELKELHGRVARAYLTLLDRYESGDVKDIKGNVKAIPASVLASCAKFLADNGIDRPEREVDLDDPLNDELPDLEDERYA